MCDGSCVCCKKPKEKYSGLIGVILAVVLSVFAFIPWLGLLCIIAIIVIGSVNCFAFDSDPLDCQKPGQSCECCVTCCRQAEDPVLELYTGSGENAKEDPPAEDPPADI